MSTPAPQQSVQKLLDENAQLIRALVENMNTKGKGMECIQYQQSLHKNLVFLASLADPSLNVKTVLPAPGSLQRPPTHGGVQTSSSGDTMASQSPATGGGGGISNHMTTSSMSTRQPQSIPSMSSAGPVSSEMQAMRQTPPGAAAVGKGYGSAMWAGQGQADPYAMQRGQLGPMGGGGGYQMGISPDQRLRIRQEQMMQAQQVRRMQQAAAAGGGGAMYPGSGHPSQGMVPSQPGIPPGYSHNPHSIPPGTRP